MVGAENIQVMRDLLKPILINLSLRDLRDEAISFLSSDKRSKPDPLCFYKNFELQTITFGNKNFSNIR